MDGFDRIYDLHRILSGRKTAIALQEILSKMECSRATFNRVKKHMTEFLGAPIIYNRELGGYQYEQSSASGYELPGLWFSQAELQALLMIQALIGQTGVGLLAEELYPISQKISQLLGKNALPIESISSKVKLLGVAVRNVNNTSLSKMVEATLRGYRIKMRYRSQDEGILTHREISPQRIINYRNNWYVDAWCHVREDYRTFALENIDQIAPSSDDYRLIDAKLLDDYFGENYGIYAGGEVDWVTLQFDTSIALRVMEESWHPQQQGELMDDGSYHLTFPFNKTNPQELIQDILRLGSQVSVLSPALLKDKVIEQLKLTLAIYQ
ncbi:helix-turn-helix transcriptional regulator [Aliikangiella maris]|uniref:WYL domain-containing protein n=2 Tax=Aliikangiella maris TaxID=3162458 RepID=A0ABV2BZ47_9GAMM